MYPILRLARLPILLCLGLLTACGLFSDEEIVWQQTRLYVPWTATLDGTAAEGSVADFMAQGGSEDDPLAGRLRVGTSLPLVVFLHGCSGELAGMPEKFQKRGFIVAAPSSFARPDRPVSCGDIGPETIRWRQEEARWVIERLSRAPWLDRHGIAVVGASEGGLAVAQFAEAPKDVVAFVILGWTCTDRDNSDFDGVRVPAGRAVYAAVGDLDPAVASGRTGGTCERALAGRPGARAVTIRGLGHNVPGDDIFDDIAAFIGGARRGTP
ncbi:hypothetical protein DKG74_12855 [Zavarzinia aquatilis]|uniref:Dienelactone hydrolase domain-containing protein n=1 Tax=Zavarzinia aquatilis TaxID=2211142 RepID=A0A317E2L9_9PROT|nr:hypothetical protein DKG74_12855 [Zavarzinia aquatilis]